MNTIRTIAKVHNEWLVKMGYDKASPLEALALITSEIGEAVNECRYGKPTEHLSEELADIVLRVFGMAEQLNIDIEEAVLSKMAKNLERGRNKGRII